MKMPQWLSDAIICPQTGNPLHLQNESFIGAGGISYPVQNGIPNLVFPADLSGEDAKWNKFYNVFAPFYDFEERMVGKYMLGISVPKARTEIVAHLHLKPGMNILEVSPGPGVYQPVLMQAISPGGSLVALDLSLPMLRQIQRKKMTENKYLFRGNASYLPFSANTFDALFHFGGLNLFTEPQRALQEFVRVVKPGGIVAYGDEAFSPSLPDGWKKRLAAKMNPGFLKPDLSPPQGIEQIIRHEVYGGYAYLVVAIKK